MKSLLKFFDGYKKECILGPLFKLLEASFELLIPLVVARIIDVGLQQENVNYIIKMCIIMVSLGIIGLTCSLCAQFFSAKAAVGFATKVRNALFSHLQSLSYTEIDKLGTGTMITRMTTDVNQLQSAVNMTLRLFLRSPFIVAGALVMACTISRKAGFIFLVVIILLSIVIYGVMIITMPMYKAVAAALDKVLVRTRDNLSGVRVIRAFRLEKNEKASFDQENDNYVRLQRRVGSISAVTNPITFAIINLGLIYLIWTGAISVFEGSLTQGEVVALVNYMSQILVELVKLANFIVLDIKGLASASRIENILKIENSMKEGLLKEADKKTEAAICFRNVSLTYSGIDEESLTDISFEVKRGETFGIIGGTGSGKTSVINLIPRFYDASKGEVLVNDVAVREYTFDTLRELIGIVPQKAVLFKGSLRDNLRWGQENATDEELMAALKASQAYDFVENKGEGLDLMVDEGGKNFSGGQRQRLTIARALVRKPEILILDDSFSALDYLTDKSLREELGRLDWNPTIVLVSQRTSSIMHADKILVLDDGDMAGIGTHEELLNDCKVYKEIYASQFSE